MVFLEIGSFPIKYSMTTKPIQRLLTSTWVPLFIPKLQFSKFSVPICKVSGIDLEARKLLVKRLKDDDSTWLSESSFWKKFCELKAYQKWLLTQAYIVESQNEYQISFVKTSQSQFLTN